MHHRLWSKEDLLFPNVVPRQADDGEKEQTKVENPARPQVGNNTSILQREVEKRRNQCVNRQGDHGEDERTGYGCDARRVSREACDLI
jgi:hypothetical protein